MNKANYLRGYVSGLLPFPFQLIKEYRVAGADRFLFKSSPFFRRPVEVFLILGIHSASPNTQNGYMRSDFDGRPEWFITLYPTKGSIPCHFAIKVEEGGVSHLG